MNMKCLVLQEISKYLRNPHKPAILAMSRPDPKKNITTLVKAFGENKTLRGLANLVLIMVSCCTPSTPLHRRNVVLLSPGVCDFRFPE